MIFVIDSLLWSSDLKLENVDKMQCFLYIKGALFDTIRVNLHNYGVISWNQGCAV